MTSSSDSIDISLSGVYESWHAFRTGKRTSRSIIAFEYNLENNIDDLTKDLQSNRYQHGPYVHLTVNDSKRRSIAVARVRDRVVHRLLYDYFVPRMDPRFDFDVWSCRKGKGLQACIERSQFLLKKYPDCWVWRSDITKFFDSVSHDLVLDITSRFISDKKALNILERVIESYQSTPGTGIAIGNLTSQILSNAYLNEFDRFIRHTIKPLGYVRYGDDFIIITPGKETARLARQASRDFLASNLKLQINTANDVVIPTKRGLRFLGVVLYGSGTAIQDRTWRRMHRRLNHSNHASYYGLTRNAGSRCQKKEFWWAGLY